MALAFFFSVFTLPQNLALCTASLMYILSRDRLNMDLDRASLDLMIRLLELEQDKSTADQLTAKEMSKVKEKIRKLCETVHNKHLDLENITVSVCFFILQCVFLLYAGAVCLQLQFIRFGD